MEALCKSGSLFEVTVPDYKQLKACHKEVRLLKELWDMIVMVRAMAGTRPGGGGRARAAGTGAGGEGTAPTSLLPLGRRRASDRVTHSSRKGG